jgi:hypothetical protein
LLFFFALSIIMLSLLLLNWQEPRFYPAASTLNPVFVAQPLGCPSLLALPYRRRAHVRRALDLDRRLAFDEPPDCAACRQPHPSDASGLKANALTVAHAHPVSDPAKDGARADRAVPSVRWNSFAALAMYRASSLSTGCARRPASARLRLMLWFSLGTARLRTCASILIAAMYRFWASTRHRSKCASAGGTGVPRLV